VGVAAAVSVASVVSAAAAGSVAVVLVGISDLSTRSVVWRR